MTEENWLQRTVNTSNVIDKLLKLYNPEQLNAITSTEQYKDAQAAMALAFSEALDDTKLSRGKRRQVGVAMIDKLMTGCAMIFVLGYDQAKRENADAQ